MNESIIAVTRNIREVLETNFSHTSPRAQPQENKRSNLKSENSPFHVADDVSMQFGLSDSESSTYDRSASTQFTTMFGKKSKRINSSNDRLPNHSKQTSSKSDDRIAQLERDIASLRASKTDKI